MNRTDRGLIILATILMLLSLGSYLGLDLLIFGEGNVTDNVTIAKLVEHHGDVRVKFHNEFQWQESRDHQSLGFEDSVFSGENAKATVEIGKSNLMLGANTLIVIRQDQRFKTLNLARGLINGRLAKNERIRIESATGDAIDLEAVETSEIVIERKGAKTGFKVISGHTQLARNGKKESLVSHDKVELYDQDKNKHDPMIFTAPDRIRYYVNEPSYSLTFSWIFESGSKPKVTDEFILEISEDAVFKQIFARENLIGDTTATLNLRSPLQAYYRVRNTRGNFSSVKKIELASPSTPAIRSPLAGAEFLYERGSKAPIVMAVSSPPSGAKVHFQIAKESFSNLVTDHVTTVGQIAEMLPAGEYSMRARFEYETDELKGVWSDSIPFSVREKINPLDLKRAHLIAHVIIPNLNYPKTIYASSTGSIQKYLSTSPPFTTMFANLNFAGYQLAARRRGLDKSGYTIAGSQFPEDWILPGLIDIEYWVTDGVSGRYPAKFHRMVIEMAPPNKLAATPEGKLSWSPILFAKSYEGQLKASTGDASTFTASRSTASVELTEGQEYSYRVRALGENSQPISAWSDEFKFQSVESPPSLGPAFAQSAPAGERHPAANEKPSSIQDHIDTKPEPTVWERLGAWFWAGSGYSYYNVRQSISSVANVEFKNTKGPSGFLEAGIMSHRRVGAIVSYARTPGEVRIDNYPVNKEDFIWTTTSLEGLYALRYRTNILTLPFVWMLRAGVQQHFFPFLYVDNGSQLTQGTNQLLSGSLGVLSEAKKGHFNYHWTMRYQHPISSGSEGGNSFTVKPIFALDGSFGTSYDIDRYIRAGLFWYGQLHFYDFTYQSAAGYNSGEQRLFHSNMEFRLGVDF